MSLLALLSWNTYFELGKYNIKTSNNTNKESSYITSRRVRKKFGVPTVMFLLLKQMGDLNAPQTIITN